MSFQVQFPVRFAHCDPAGIVYYPRYFELIDHAVEDWTEQVLGSGRRDLHMRQGLGLPLVGLGASFASPSRLGDILTIRLDVLAVGRSSVTLRALVTREGERRFSVELKQVLMNLSSAKSVAWPDEWRQRLEAQMAGSQA